MRKGVVGLARFVLGLVVGFFSGVSMILGAAGLLSIPLFVFGWWTIVSVILLLGPVVVAAALQVIHGGKLVSMKGIVLGTALGAVVTCLIAIGPRITP